MLEKSENNVTEEIGLVTPPLGSNDHTFPTNNMHNSVDSTSSLSATNPTHLGSGTSCIIERMLGV